MLDVEFTQLSDPGRTREHNEDYLGYVLPYTPAQLRSHGCVFALADGVGGQRKGEVASQLAVETVLAGFSAAKSGEAHKALAVAPDPDCEPAGVRTRSGLAGQSRNGYDHRGLRSARRPRRHRPRRRFALLPGARRPRSPNHPRPHHRRRAGPPGNTSASEAAESPNRHLLSRSVGNDMVVNVEIDEVQVQKGDMLLQCSDGLHGSVLPEDMVSVIDRVGSLSIAVERLVELANQRDGSDNISVQLIRIHDVERTGMYRGRPYNLR